MSVLAPLVPQQLVIAVLVAPVASSADEPVSRLPTGRIVEKVVSLDDPSQQYALYLPSAYAAVDRDWPVLFVLDPRGRAIPGIERFLPAAERRGYVVLSSYQSRSDTYRDINFHALNALLVDGQRRFRLDMRRIYLAGMSGTAHAAWRFGQILEGHVAGVIAAVGGVQTRTQGPPGDARFSYYGITGTSDFNYQEMMRLEQHLLESDIDHRIEIFDGSHGWPPHDYTNRALDWMEFQAVKQGLASPKVELVDTELERARTGAAAAQDPLDQLRRYRDVVRDFKGLREVDADLAMARRLENDPRVDRRRTQEKKLARAEEAYLRARYDPWLVEIRNPEKRLPTVAQSLVVLRIAALQKRAADKENLAEAHSALRSLESLYTGVAYYLTGELERAGDLERAIRALEVAVKIFPDRVRGHWRLAAANAKAGRTEAALDALAHATSHGHVDIERLKTDPTWESLRDRPEWAELVALLEGASG